MLSRRTAANTLLAILLGVVLLFALLIAMSGRSHAAPTPPPVHRVELQGHDNEVPLGDVAKPKPEDDPYMDDLGDFSWSEHSLARTTVQI